MSGLVGQRFGLVSRDTLFVLRALPPMATRIYLTLAVHADAEGWCYPSRAAIADMAGTGEEVTRRSMRQLEAAGLVVTDRGSGRRGSRYHLAFHPLQGGPKEGGLQRGGRPESGGWGDRSEGAAPTVRSPVTHQENTPENTKKSDGVRRTRLPDDFALTEERRNYAVGKGCRNPERTFEAFATFYRGSGKTQLDWDATFRTWVLGAHGGPAWKACGCQPLSLPSAGRSGGKPSVRDMARDIAAKWAAEGAG